MSGDEVRYRAVVSDLHVGDGGKLENFIYGPAFLRFLAELARRGSEANGRAELILNGDILDFLQIAPLSHGPWRDAVQKLDSAFAAHSDIFDELGRFVANGHRLVVLVGNHDIELMFRTLQEKFIERIAGGTPSCRERIVFPNDAKLDAHRFQGWGQGPFVCRVSGVHIEHGNQLDSVNCFDHAKFYEDDVKQLLRLPWGSRFVLSVFNEAASKYRYLDKVRSKVAAGLILWCLDPTLAQKLMPGFASLGARWVNALSNYYLNRQAPVGGGARAVGAGDESAFAVFGEWAMALQAAVDFPVTAVPAGARGEPALKARLELLRAAVSKNTIAESKQADDGYADDAFAVAEQENAHTVIFGHTHGARDISRAGKRYLNTGTWIDRIELDRLDAALRRGEGNTWSAIEALLDPASFRSAPVLSYVEIVDGRVALGEWK